jgi:hypothetical protein
VQQSLSRMGFDGGMRPAPPVPRPRARGLRVAQRHA